MPNEFQAWSQQVRRLHAAIVQLAPMARNFGVPPPHGEEWFELLQNKLLPQLDAQPFLVVAVVGGTNIGKSVVFNHLAGEMASAVSPLAAGTRHPVCLVPPGFDDANLLAMLFAGFRLQAWQSAEDALSDEADHLLFWRVGGNVPERLLLLDTPDIDSDAPVNWQRADHVRQAADVLVAVLTQQKYNDAAVKQFFRKAAAADKPVIVVFNQCDLEDDRDYWPLWLDTFCQQTGAQPDLVYVVPYDRKAASELRLAFHEAGHNHAKHQRGAAASPSPGVAVGSSLRHELAALHFDAIKIRTFRGAMARVLDPAQGVPGYLEQIRAASGEFETAVRAVASLKTTPVGWPTLPARMLVDEIRIWWDDHRSQWSRRVHDSYRTVINGVLWPVRKAWQTVSPPRRPQADLFQQEERQAIVQAIENLLAELDRLAQVGNDTLRPRLAKLLSGESRGDLLRRVQASHTELPSIDDDYRQFLRTELDQWEEQNPRAVTVLRSMDQVLALARPAITVSLAISGWFLAGGLVHDAAVQVVGHTAGQLATEAVITGGITGGGEVLVNTAGEGVKQAAARLFGRLQTRYTELRAGWLWRWLEQELLRDLLTDLRRGAELPRQAAFCEVETALSELGSTHQS